ncbi:MAG: hypothetical protein E3J86_06455 [Candidatus Thorarchaeota archaeon]|nr:MAG: hypothetical protein E3J86_06455 [Candidatus Thorarchaeota archaeon]
MINQQRVLSISVYILVVLTLLTAIYLFGSFWNGFNVGLIAGAQMIILALGLSAIALAIMQISYKEV